MAKFLVHYSNPKQLGDFIIDAVDWFQAEKILESYLEAIGSKIESSNSMVVEFNEKITYLGKGI